MKEMWITSACPQLHEKLLNIYPSFSTEDSEGCPQINPCLI